MLIRLFPNSHTKTLGLPVQISGLRGCAVPLYRPDLRKASGSPRNSGPYFSSAQAGRLSLPACAEEVLQQARSPGRRSLPTSQAAEPQVAAERNCGGEHLEECARLFVDDYLNSITVPELMNEPFDRGDFNLTPPHINIDTGTYSCALPKFREALPLLRMMMGSKKGLDIDQAWAENILKCIGPDGLYYVPRVGRPWDE